MSSIALDDFHTYTFGAFTLDTVRGALLKDGVEIDLRPQSFDILRVLVSRIGILVTREELQSAVWGRKVVTDGSLAQCLIDIRKALGDSDRKIIRTISRRGYILNLPVVVQTEPTIDKSPAVSERPPIKHLLASTALAMTALAVFWFFVGIDLFMTAPAQDKSIAVLPFLDLSEDKSQEYFADGVTEELLNLLSKVPELRVISRTSTSSFKGKDIAVPDIAERLNVAHVLEGSVRKSGNRIRITTQLIEATSDTHLWSETYEFELKDIFAIEDEVSAQVVSELKIALLGDAPKSIVTNPEAYELFLQARFLADQITVDSVQKAIELYKRVLDIDPEYVPAWVWMANAHNNMFLLNVPDANEHLRLQEVSINRALAIDPNNAIALAIASGMSTYNGDIELAVSQIRRALEIAPNDLEVIRSSAFILEKLSRNSDYLNVMEYVFTRDPLNGVVRADTTFANLSIGNYQRAIELSEQTLGMWPDNITALIILPAAIYRAGDPEAALKLSEQIPLAWYRILFATLTYYVRGDQNAYESGIREMLQMLEDGEPASTHYEMASLFNAVDDREAAFSELEKSIELSEPIFRFDDVVFTTMFDDPRYDALMERAGMPREKMEAIQFEVTIPSQ